MVHFDNKAVVKLYQQQNNAKEITDEVMKKCLTYSKNGS